MIVRFFDRLLSSLLLFVAFTVGTQLPAFMDAYQQHLNGRVEQINEDILTLGEQGRPLAARAIELANAAETLKLAGPFMRPYEFARLVEPKIAMSVLEAYVPAISFSTETLIYAGVLMLIAHLVWELITAPFRNRVPYYDT